MLMTTIIVACMFAIFLYPEDKMKNQKINLMMHVEFMAPLRSTKWLAIFTSLPASKYSFMLE